MISLANTDRHHTIFMILFDFKEYSEKLKHVVNFFWHLLPAAVAETQIRINKIYSMVFLKIITY